MTDFLNRIVPDLTPDLVTTARNNLLNCSSELKNRFNYDEISDNDAVIIAKLGVSLLSSAKCDLYMADDWRILAENIVLSDSSDSSKGRDGSELIDIRKGYETDEKWTTIVKSTKNILMKTPPPSFVEKWSLIGEESFRVRMRQSDVNSVITVRLAVALSKGQEITEVYFTHDWELLMNNLKMVTIE